MNITIEFRAFETPDTIRRIKFTKTYSLVLSDIEQESFILEDLFRAFNHAIPGKTGELAEEFNTRSLSVGDRVALNGKWFECASIGWKEI